MLLFPAAAAASLPLLQAMDRAHRIGQVRPVVVYRLVTEGASIERALVRRAAGKSSLSRMVLQEGRARLLGSAPVGSPCGAASPTAASASAVAASASGLDHEDGEDELLEPSSSLSSAGAGSKPASATAATAAAAGGPRIGVATEKMLSFWLREDVTDRTLITGGVSGEFPISTCSLI